MIDHVSRRVDGKMSYLLERPPFKIEAQRARHIVRGTARYRHIVYPPSGKDFLCIGSTYSDTNRPLRDDLDEPFRSGQQIDICVVVVGLRTQADDGNRQIASFDVLRHSSEIELRKQEVCSSDEDHIESLMHFARIDAVVPCDFVVCDPFEQAVGNELVASIASGLRKLR